MRFLVAKQSWRPARGMPRALTAGRRSRLVLIELHGLLRDGLAQLISTCIREAIVECYARVEDVIPGSATLLLIGVDPRRECAAESVQVKFQTLRGLCGEAPIGVMLACDDIELRRRLSALGVAGVVQHEGSLAVAIAAIQLMWVGGSCFPPEPSRDVEYAPAWPLQSQTPKPAPAAAAPEPRREEVDREFGVDLPRMRRSENSAQWPSEQDHRARTRHLREHGESASSQTDEKDARVEPHPSRARREPGRMKSRV